MLWLQPLFVPVSFLLRGRLLCAAPASQGNHPPPAPEVWGARMLLIYHLVSIKIYGSDYCSAPPNQTRFIQPFFTPCCCGNSSCFHSRPPGVRLSPGNVLDDHGDASQPRTLRNNHTPAPHFPECKVMSVFRHLGGVSLALCSPCDRLLLGWIT